LETGGDLLGGGTSKSLQVLCNAGKEGGKELQKICNGRAEVLEKVEEEG
jgi:hypothetical protein